MADAQVSEAQGLTPLHKIFILGAVRGIAIIVATLLVGTVPVYARHGHHHHSVHHKGAKHERITPHNKRNNPILEKTFKSTPAPKDIDPEALAFAYPQEHFGDRPRKMVGRLAVADKEFAFVSGGTGWSIPWGHWPVTPAEVGRWGARHGALGLNAGDDIPDPRLHRGREGVEIHAANHDATAGCVGIRERYDELKRLVLGMIERWGHAYLHITPHAVAITPSKYLPPTATVGKVAAASDDDDEPRHHRHRHRHT